jgi:glycosyltransferase involved in cell wall biosynthesis
LELSGRLEEFAPQLIHAHHPFLLGDTAARAASKRALPLVYTHHTMYEYYTHYMPGDSPAMKDYIVRLSARYADLCDGVVAPSESVAAILRERGVESSIRPIPTGVKSGDFSQGDGQAFRRGLGIPPEAFLIGHLGRLAEEKNLPFLARSVLACLREREGAHFLVVGDGDGRPGMEAMVAEAALQDRVHFAGLRKGQELVDAYHAMDLFAFASRSETQGMVMAEAMAAGCPVVALDAPGAREVVEEGVNGRLVKAEKVEDFAAALGWVMDRPEAERRELARAAAARGRDYDIEHCLDALVDFYGEIIARRPAEKDVDQSDFQKLLRSAGREWTLWANRFHAAAHALLGD